VADEAKNANAEGADKKGKSNIILIVVIAVVALLLIVGALVAFMMLSDSPKEATSVESGAVPVEKKVSNSAKKSGYLTVGPMYPMDQFIVNLLSQNVKRYVKLMLNLELEHEQMVPELDSKKAVVRDIVITILSSKTIEEVSTLKGKERLKEEILKKLNEEVIVDGSIKNIFFTEFVIQ